MTKYIFYAAFLYFCWYAGNKAFPATTLQPASVTKSASTWVSTADKYPVINNDVNAEKQTPVNSKIENKEVEERAGRSKQRPLFHINTNITSSHNLFIHPKSSYTGQLNFYTHPVTSKNAIQPLTVLNKIEK